MTNRQLHRYEMLVRVSEFGASHRERFPEPSLAGQAFAVIANAVGQLKDRAVAQLALRREGARARAAARAALLERLQSISRTARIIQEDDPSFPNTFHLPERASAQAVLTAARLFARDIEPVAKRFLDHAMPETMVGDLKSALATYEESIRRREVGKGESAAARAAIEATMDSALVAVRRLDVIIANQMRDDAVIIAEWERDRHVSYARRHPAPEMPVDPATEPVAPPAVIPPAPPVMPPDEPDDEAA
jgi:hypothetical protein